MIGIDTNVLVRYLTYDNKKQSEIAAKYLEKNCTAEEPGFIASITLCELVWVLDSVYKYHKESIVVALYSVLTAAELLVEHQEEAIKAMRCFEKGRADFSDYYIAYINKKHKVDKVITFDKKAAKGEMFELLSS